MTPEQRRELGRLIAQHGVAARWGKVEDPRDLIAAADALVAFVEQLLREAKG